MAFRPWRWGKIVLSERGRCFYSGLPSHPIYVEGLRARGDSSKPPVIMVHGGAHTGSCYVSTPDLRPGWLALFADAGHDAYAIDLPGHGRSPMGPDFATLSTLQIASSVLAVVEAIGPAILIVHSAGGPIAWWIAEQRPASVLAIVGLAPGPPANILPVLPDDPEQVNALRNDESMGCPICVPEESPVWIPSAFMEAFWANGDRFPKAAFENYRRSVVPESARLLNERFNIGGRGLRIADPRNLADHPILIVTGDQDPRHPRKIDAATAAYLGAEFLWLPDRGITGNGHMLMIEDNSEQISRLVLAWIAAQGF